MKIEEFEVIRFSEWDGFPIKNKLPEELRQRLKTEEQWFDEGFLVKRGAAAYQMHANVMGKRVYEYYLDSDVVLR